MAKKDLNGLEKEVEKSPTKLLEENRNDDKRLTFPVTGADHKAFKKEAADAGLSMTDYFLRIWKQNR